MAQKMNSHHWAFSKLYYGLFSETVKKKSKETVWSSLEKTVLKIAGESLHIKASVFLKLNVH